MTKLFHNDLTRPQYDSMCDFEGHVGKTIEVMTSQYEKNVSPEFLKRKVGSWHNASALRGLERKGYIRIEDTYWRGATITVLKGMGN